MSNDDWRRNDRERDRSRDQDYERMRGSQGPSYGRGSDYRGDGTIAQRGFGNERSGYGRGGDDRNQDYGRSGGGDYDRGGSGRVGREDMGDRFGDRGAFGSDYRGGGMAGGRREPDYSGGLYDDDRNRRSGFDDQRSYGRGSREQDERGFWDRATDEVSSWFGDDEAERRRRQDDHRSGDWTGQSHRGRGPKGYTRSDDRIQEDVCERLSHDHHVDASEIEVSVSGREVTLSGTVDSRDARRRAEDIAESVSGVTHVQNNLRVQQQGLTSGMGSNQGMTSGSGLSGSTMGGGAGMTSGTTAQSSTGVEVSRTEGSTARRRTGTTT
jgi:osmotically-inducible protein OsmY